MFQLSHTVAVWVVECGEEQLHTASNVSQENILGITIRRVSDEHPLIIFNYCKGNICLYSSDLYHIYVCVCISISMYMCVYTHTYIFISDNTNTPCSLYLMLIFILNWPFLLENQFSWRTKFPVLSVPYLSVILSRVEAPELHTVCISMFIVVFVSYTWLPKHEQEQVNNSHPNMNAMFVPLSHQTP